MAAPEEILRALDLHNGSVVVDLGCGSGYFTLKLSASVGPHGQVLAVDIRRLPLVFLLNTYHELDDAPAVLAQVRRALRQGGRLVVVDRGPRPAKAPVAGEHELEPSEGAAGLGAAGFEIVERDDAFIDRAGDPDLWWMIVARRP